MIDTHNNRNFQHYHNIDVRAQSCSCSHLCPTHMYPCAHMGRLHPTQTRKIVDLHIVVEVEVAVVVGMAGRTSGQRGLWVRQVELPWWRRRQERESLVKRQL